MSRTHRKKRITKPRLKPTRRVPTQSLSTPQLNLLLVTSPAARIVDYSVANGFGVSQDVCNQLCSDIEALRAARQ